MGFFNSQSKAMVFFITIFFLLNISVSYAMKPYKDYENSPEDFGIAYESVSFKTIDGYTLTGWFLPSNQDSARATIVVSYGDAGNMGYMIGLSNIFTSTGYNVLLYDYRGFGKSQEFDTDKDMLIYTEFLYDLNSAIDFVKANYGGQIVLFGFSLGATLSIAVTGQRNDITAVIAEGAYTSTDEVLKKINELEANEEDERRIFQLPHGYPSSAQPINAVKSFSNTALFILTGSDDKICTPDMAYQLYSQCDSPQKSIWIAAETAHGRIVQDYEELYSDIILTFLTKVLD